MMSQKSPVKTGYILTVLFSFFVIGCTTYKNVPYFQEQSNQNGIKENISNFSPLTIEPGDILGISVSSQNPEASAVFNYSLNRITGNNNDMSSTNPVTGYLVDSIGMIQVPYLGKVKVAGKSLESVRASLQSELPVYLKSPLVNIRLLNFKVSVLGDVLRPDVYQITEERFTILDAISKAGDLNITAKRSNVMLIREKAGLREYVTLDLKSKDIFRSPYYYLRNNDIIYVQPGKSKLSTIDRGYKTGSLILSGLSILAIVISNLVK